MSAKHVWRASSSVCTSCRQFAPQGQIHRSFRSMRSRRNDGSDTSTTSTSTSASTPQPASTGGVQDALTGLISSTLSQSGRQGARKVPTNPAWASSSASTNARANGVTENKQPISRPTKTPRYARSQTKVPALRDILGSGFEPDEELAKMGSQGESEPLPPHRLYVYCHKRNTHLTLSQASRPATDTASSAISNLTTVAVERKKMVDTLLSKSTGQLGFKKAGRGTYDAAFQLGSYFLEQMKEKGMYRDLARLELVLRGFGPGREAIQKLILGPEGRFLKERIVSIADATRLKIGGCRSPKRRRLG